MSALSFPMLALLALAGVFGAMLRYLIDVSITSRQQRRAPARSAPGSAAASSSGAPLFPWGILTANTLACFLMATAAGYAAHTGINPGADFGTGPGSIAVLAVTVGFCGSLSTMSTFIVSLVGMLRSGSRALASAYLGASLAAGLLAAGLGLLLAAGLATGFPAPGSTG